MLDTSPIVERLYDAVLDFDLWPDTIRALSDVLGGSGSALLSNTRRTGLWVRVDPAARTLFERRFLSSNPIHDYATRARALPGYSPAVLTDRDISAQVDLRRTAYFNEFLEPFDGPSSLAFDLGVRKNGMTAALNLSRTARQGAFDAAQIEAARLLHPHITRAFWLSVKLAEKASLRDGALALIEHAGFAMLLLDGEGKIAHANEMAESMLRARDGLRSEGRSLCGLRSDATAALQRLISAAVFERKGGNCSVGRPMRLPLAVSITPLSADRAPLFGIRPSAVVCVFDPTAPSSFSAEHLREMFGLSAAEARVALRLLDGLDQKEIAAALNISFFTVRAHLSQIYQKTHTNRQAEFVALVLRAMHPALFGRPQ